MTFDGCREDVLHGPTLRVTNAHIVPCTAHILCHKTLHMLFLGSILFFSHMSFRNIKMCQGDAKNDATFDSSFLKARSFYLCRLKYGKRGILYIFNPVILAWRNHHVREGFYFQLHNGSKQKPINIHREKKFYRRNPLLTRSLSSQIFIWVVFLKQSFTPSICKRG